MTELNDSPESLAKRLAALEGKVKDIDGQFKEIRTLLALILLKADPLERIQTMKSLLEMGIGQDVIDTACQIIEERRQQGTDHQNASDKDEAS